MSPADRAPTAEREKTDESLRAGSVTNWTYQATLNAIAFTSFVPLTTGDQISVTYPLGCN